MTGVRLIPSYDLGSDENDPNFMHSPYKKELAERIARAVLADLYGADGAKKTYPPEIVSATLSDDKTYFTVKFKNVGDGLISDSGDGKVDGFGVGTVTKLVPAEAEIISADTVKVTVPEKAKLSGIGYAASPHVEKESSHLRSSYGMPALAFYKAVNGRQVIHQNIEKRLVMKKITAVLLAALMLLSFAACERADTEGTGSTVTESDTITDKETNDMTDTETESPIVDEEPVYYENPGRAPLDPDTVDYSGADWEKTIVNANARANGVSGNFTDAARNGFLVKNETSSLLYDLTSAGNKQVAGLYNSHGVPYFENTDGAFIILPDGTELSSAQSLSYARMNSRRIG